MSYKLKICPNCSTENYPGDKKCVKCKHSLSDVKASEFDSYTGAEVEEAPHEAKKSKASAVDNEEINFCPNCGTKASGAFCTKCGKQFKTKTGGRKKLFRYSGLAVIVLVLVTLRAAAVSQQGSVAGANPAPTAAQPTFPVPAQVQPIVSELGIDTNTLDKVNITLPADNSSCKSAALAEAAACFYPAVPPSTAPRMTYPVTVLNSAKNVRNATFAHEYLHYIWSIMPQSEKDSLTPYIEQAYQNAKPYLDTRIKAYNFTAEGTGSRINELHSYVGTEIADSLIPAPLLDHYKKYLPNRDALPSYYPYPVVPKYTPPVYTYVPPVYIPPPVHIPNCYTYQHATWNSITMQMDYAPYTECY